MLGFLLLKRYGHLFHSFVAISPIFTYEILAKRIELGSSMPTLNPITYNILEKILPILKNELIEVEKLINHPVNVYLFLGEKEDSNLFKSAMEWYENIAVLPKHIDIIKQAGH